MGKPIIVVSSLTYAIRGQKVLERYGIQSHIERNARTAGSHGCGYGLRVRGNAATAQAALIQSGIKVLDILEDGEDGNAVF